MIHLIFPTALHQQATETITTFFLTQPNIDTILLTNSLARGKATADSDIDMAILVAQETSSTAIATLGNSWQAFLHTNTILNQYKDFGKFAHIHLDIIDGVFEPAIWEDGGEVDFFEVEIGNRLVYSLPLTSEGAYFKKLKLMWLPYYNKTLQLQRLQLAKGACLYELDHIPVFVNRGLYFQAFDRLYISFQKFLQALFIKHKTYPIAYNKWIKDQVTGILKLPELYKELPKLISVNKLESFELCDKAAMLHTLLEQYC